MSASYHFITHWDVPFPRDEVVDIISDAESLPRWWPSVYLEVKQLEAGDTKGVGRRISLYTKGWLPYTLRWNFTITESDPPNGFTLVADGDFIGRGIWTFEAAGERTHVTYDWKIDAEKPLLKYGSFILKPMFSRNHEWAMRQGEISLNLELERRRALRDGAAPATAAPPAATPSNAMAWLGSVTGLRRQASPAHRE